MHQRGMGLLLAVLGLSPVASAQDEWTEPAERFGKAIAVTHQRSCEEEWPQAKKSSRELTETCIRYWLARHAYQLEEQDPKMALEALVESMTLDPPHSPAQPSRFTRAHFAQMAEHLRAVCGRCQQHWLYARAAEYFTACRDSYYSLGSDGYPFKSVLARVLEGKRLTQEPPLSYASALDVWRLRNAVFARHGRPFKNPDLHTFFYERPSEGKGFPLLPRKVNPGYSDELLTETDRQNLDELLKHQKPE